MKGVIPTPDIAKIFHPTPDIEAKKFPTLRLKIHPNTRHPPSKRQKKTKKTKIFRDFGTISHLEQSLSNFFCAFGTDFSFNILHNRSISSKVLSVTIEHEHCFGSFIIYVRGCFFHGGPELVLIWNIPHQSRSPVAGPGIFFCFLNNAFPQGIQNNNPRVQKNPIRGNMGNF